MAKKSAIQTKRNQIYCTIREEIATGKYPGGTFLVESSLCEQFSVSRTPVREAIIRLSQDGFVELIPNRGALIPQLSISDINNLCELRAANEGLAAYLIAKDHTDAILEKLSASIERQELLMEDADVDPHQVSHEDFCFHILLSKFCNNSRLSAVLDTIENQMKRMVYLVADDYAVKTTLPVSVAAHKHAVGAIRAGNGDEAQRIMIQHWRDMKEGYIHRSVTGRLPVTL